MLFKAKTLSLTLVLSIILLTCAHAVNMWPDKIQPPIQLDAADRMAVIEIKKQEMDEVYCINATLLAGDNADTATGYWLLSYETELGQNYSAAVRMDGRVSVRRIKEVKVKSGNSWPETITPPVSLMEAIVKAEETLESKKRNLHYCINATLVSGSNDIMKDGMWNLVFQVTTDDPVLINVRMNGKTDFKQIEQIRQS